MCGIVGYIGDQEAGSVLIDGLRRLEYRGYDSSGVAVLNGADVQLRRAVGKLPQLEGVLREEPVHGHLGLGHTRWATHGRPSEENAHPHLCCRSRIAVVHNGIIENYLELKARLEIQGHRFRSQTDTEVVAHLIESLYRGHLLTAVREALLQTRGSYALGVIMTDERDRMIVARKDSPLVIGVGEGENFVASDVPALLPHTRRVLFLEDGELAEVTQGAVQIWDGAGNAVRREPVTIGWDAGMAEKGGYAHFMLKEIFEQPVSVRESFRGRISLEEARVQFEQTIDPSLIRRLQRVCLLGCGTSYHAGLVARGWIEELAGLPCDVEIASEYRYRHPVRDPNTLVIAISQSGETADTLAALRDCASQGSPTLAICNAVGSSMTREAEQTLYTICGPEVGVASTKAFTGQLTVLFLTAFYLGQERGRLGLAERQSLLEELLRIPVLMNRVLRQAPTLEAMAPWAGQARHALFLGRQLNYPIALEGALKLKEISYVHAEGYPAGEMKHGPIALVDSTVPAVFVMPGNSVRDKMLSNLEEVKARGGPSLAIATEGDAAVASKADYVFWLPHVPDILSPLLTILPLQLLAYYAAVFRGCDVDQPRNLAKSVTVE